MKISMTTKSTKEKLMKQSIKFFKSKESTIKIEDDKTNTVKLII